jgi:hypothetical protein
MPRAAFPARSLYPLFQVPWAGRHHCYMLLVCVFLAVGPADGCSSTHYQQKRLYGRLSLWVGRCWLAEFEVGGMVVCSGDSSGRCLPAVLLGDGRLGEM